MVICRYKTQLPSYLESRQSLNLAGLLAIISSILQPNVLYLLSTEMKISIVFLLVAAFFIVLVENVKSATPAPTDSTNENSAIIETNVKMNSAPAPPTIPLLPSTSFIQQNPFYSPYQSPYFWQPQPFQYGPYRPQHHQHYQPALPYHQYGQYQPQVPVQQPQLIPSIPSDGGNVDDSVSSNATASVSSDDANTTTGATASDSASSSITLQPSQQPSDTNTINKTPTAAAANSDEGAVSSRQRRQISAADNTQLNVFRKIREIQHFIAGILDLAFPILHMAFPQHFNPPCSESSSPQQVSDQQEPKLSAAELNLIQAEKNAAAAAYYGNNLQTTPSSVSYQQQPFNKLTSKDSNEDDDDDDVHDDSDEKI